MFNMGVVRRAAYSLGMMVRETGQALDRAGSSLQGAYAYTEQCKSTEARPRCRDRTSVFVGNFPNERLTSSSLERLF